MGLEVKWARCHDSRFTAILPFSNTGPHMNETPDQCWWAASGSGQTANAGQLLAKSTCLWCRGRQSPCSAVVNFVRTKRLWKPFRSRRQPCSPTPNLLFFTFVFQKLFLPELCQVGMFSGQMLWKSSRVSMERPRSSYDKSVVFRWVVQVCRIVLSV